MERMHKRDNATPSRQGAAQARFTSRSRENQFSRGIDESPAMVAQRQRLDNLFGPAIQRVEDEEPLQGKFDAVQRVEEEEPLQGKFDAVQRVEEEEPLQGKFDTAQRVEEEEPLQGKFKTAQRVEEEEPLQGKFETAQRVEEEEPLQGKFETTQRAEDEEPLQGKFAVAQLKHELGEEEFLPGKFGTSQRVEDEEPLQGKFEAASAIQLKGGGAKPNNTGLPDNLKSGIESLSGMSMDNVRVHYNSSQPAQLNAHAYAQGMDIHVAPGQEQHLPHEAWHVVQQAQGRVQPTMQMKEGVPVNDDKSLEQEADVMGAKAMQMRRRHAKSIALQPNHSLIQREVANDKLNVIGENHDESDPRRELEASYAKKFISDDAGYWGEADFALGDKINWGDPKHLRLFFLLHKIKEHFTPLETLSEKYALLQAEPMNHQLELMRNSMQIGLETYFNRLINEVSVNVALAKQQKYALGGQMAVPEFVAMGRETTALKRKLQQKIDALTGYINDPTGAGDDFFSDLWFTCTDIIGLESMVYTDLGNSNAVRYERSRKMHEAADEGAGRKGIWKIGQLHVVDIKLIDSDDERSYELIDKNDFDNCFGTALSESKENSRISFDAVTNQIKGWTQAALKRTPLWKEINADLANPKLNWFNDQVVRNMDKKIKKLSSYLKVLHQIQVRRIDPDYLYSSANKATRRKLGISHDFNVKKQTFIRLLEQGKPESFISSALDLCDQMKDITNRLMIEAATEESSSLSDSWHFGFF